MGLASPPSQRIPVPQAGFSPDAVSSGIACPFVSYGPAQFGSTKGLSVGPEANTAAPSDAGRAYVRLI